MTAFQQFRPLYQDLNLPKLQRDIVERSSHGTIKYSGWNGPEITAPLASIANAVESAYVLVEKATLPKVHEVISPLESRVYSVSGEPSSLLVSVGDNSTHARRRGTAWLSIAAHLEAEEKTAAAEVKRKADAEKAEAERARHNRLNDIADLHFGKDFDELGDNKASAVKEIYRLEEQLKTDTDERDAA